MTEKQIEKIQSSIKSLRAALVGEKRLYGGFHDGSGSRYYIAYLYLKISDYKGVITYKKWFDKNFPDDVADPMLSFVWAQAFYELGQIAESKHYTIGTALQNVYLHGLLLERSVERIECFESSGYDLLEFTKSNMKEFTKVATKSYLTWLSGFVASEEYLAPINKFIALKNLLMDENPSNIETQLHQQIEDLEDLYR